MWVSRKEYLFLKENAEKNIDAECEILRAKEVCTKKIALAMEEYSKVLGDLHEIKKYLKYYLDTNEENGVVYIPKFVIEKMVNDNLKTNF